MSKKLLIGIDRQHTGQAGKHINSVGAAKDIDGNGTADHYEAEAIWTARYGLQLEIELRGMGYHPLPISDGSYQQRADRFNYYATHYDGDACYVALHCNAGGGDYSVFFYDYRSSEGKRLAQAMADQMAIMCPYIAGHNIRAARPDDWTKNAFYTIKNVGNPVAICAEPLFLDNVKHRRYLTQAGMLQIGTAIAKGIDQWIQTKS